MSPLSKPNAKDAAAQPDWQPTAQQLDSPEKLQLAFKQLLAQHYELRDAHARTLQQLQDLHRQVNTRPQFPPGNGPIDTLVLGLPVQPIDAVALADGAVLKYDKANGQFKFA